jgi:hypothetical protein
MQLFQIVLATTALAIPAVTAFAPSTTKGSSATKLNAGKTYLNGWVPEDMTTKFCYGLPGSVVSFFLFLNYLICSFHIQNHALPSSGVASFVD